LRSLRFVLAGPGALGLSLSWALCRMGHRCVGVQGHGASGTARARVRLKTTSIVPGREGVAFDLLLIAVPDDAIATVCRAWSRSSHGWHGRFAIHASGALSSEILEPLRRRGAHCGSFHPLTSLPRASFEPGLFAGVTFGVEGDAAFRTLARSLVAGLRGRVLHLSPATKAAYHLAACLSSGYLLAYLTLISEAFEQKASMKPGQSMDGFLDLASATLRNAERAGLQRSLTGPILRADLGTLQLHEKVLRRMPDVYRTAYRILAEKLLDLGERSGRLKGAAARRVRRHFSRLPMGKIR